MLLNCVLGNIAVMSHRLRLKDRSWLSSRLLVEPRLRLRPRNDRVGWRGTSNSVTCEIASIQHAAVVVVGVRVSLALDRSDECARRS